MSQAMPPNQLQPPPPDRARYIAGIEVTEDQIREGGRAKPRISWEDSRILNARRKELLKSYFALLPILPLSRCPICDAVLLAQFDPWGFDGPWWQQDRAIYAAPPAGCEHFRVLTGAVVLTPGVVKGGSVPSHIGADAPFVIPKVLELPTMVAAIAAIPMSSGHRAFPIAYFSSQPPPAPDLANPWTKTSCTFTTPSGKSSFAYKTDPWDFDLLPWVSAGKLRWIDPKSDKAELSKDPPAKFPFVFPAALHHRQIVLGNKVLTEPPPNNEVINPFGD
jgi:hypothetical protein